LYRSYFRLKKGRSKKAHLLCEAVFQATQNFIAKGEEIANENGEVRSEMLGAVDDVRKTGLLLFSLLWLLLVVFIELYMRNGSSMGLEITSQLFLTVIKTTPVIAIVLASSSFKLKSVPTSEMYDL